MERPALNLYLATVFSLILLSPAGTESHTQDPVRINGQRLMANLESLSRIGRSPQGGNSRVAFSETDREARQYVMGLMRSAGLEVSVDAAGNILGRRAGTVPGLPLLMLGSHIDSVPEGGHYDGPLGSLGAIGVVTGIVGIRRWTVTVEGMANHAGTTPMNNRRDALLTAALFIQTVNQVVTGMEGDQVGTVGMIQASPGAPNVIPGLVTMSLELRDLDMAKIESVFHAIQSRAQDIAAGSGTTIELDEFYLSRGAPADNRVIQLIEESATALGLSSRRMPSGAGHDAQSIAPLAPTGMIFIPSIGGISHSPVEYSRPEDIVAGVNVLLGALLKLDTF